MKQTRPDWDPNAEHVVRGGEMLWNGRKIADGEVFEVTPENERRAAQLFRMARIVQRSELEAKPTAPTKTRKRAPRKAAKRKRKPAARKSKIAPAVAAPA